MRQRKSELESYYLEFYEFASVGYLSLNEDNLIVEINLAATQLLGIPRFKLINKSFSQFITKASKPVFYAHRDQVFSSNIKQTCELELIRKNRTSFFTHVESIIKHNTINKTATVHVSLVDITDRILSKKAWQASEEKFHSFVENTKEWVWAVNTNGCYTYSNPSVQAILGYTPQELMGRSRVLLLHSEDRSNFIAQKIQLLRSKNGWNDQMLRYQHKNGSYRYLESNATPIFDDNGWTVGFRGTDRDITERKHTEEQMHKHELALSQAARIRSLGELASALAHELTQPLTAINNFVTGCVHRLKAGAHQNQELLEIMREVESQASRAGEIIHHMKDFMRQGKLYWEKVDLVEILQNAITLIKKELPDSGVKIYLELLKESVYLMADKIQLELVILNLLRNSIEAIESDTALLKKEVCVSLQTTDHHWAKIKIIDTGPGISAELANKVFNPCFTTKPDSMGMGLSICRTIIETHGGNISANPKTDDGACFELELPLIISQQIN